MNVTALRPPLGRIDLHPRPVVCLSLGIVAWSECERERDLMRRRYLDAVEHARNNRSARRGRR